MRTVIQGGGVKHLVTMATSEHMIMQNEALVALGLIAGLDLGKSKNSSSFAIYLISIFFLWNNTSPCLQHRNMQTPVL